MKDLRFKNFPVEVKAADEDEPGVFEAIVSVFGNVDRGGDRVLKGAFARTLKDRGLPPILWSHDFGRPPIGVALDAKEVDEGLWIKARLFLDDSARAREVNAGLKHGAISEFSFAYDVKEAAPVTEDGEDIYELKDLDLWEVSPVVVGMNPATRLVRPPKAGVSKDDGGDADGERESRPASTPAHVELFLDARSPNPGE